MRNTKTAFAVVVPAEVADQIESIRAQYDSSFARWPPHINVCWPFVDQRRFNEVQAKLLALDPLPDTRVTLGRLYCSKGSQYVEVEAQVEGSQLRDLRRRVFEALGEEDPAADWTPHLTLGQVPVKEVQALVQRLQQSFQEVSFPLEGTLHMMERKGERFRSVLNVWGLFG